MKKLFLKLKEAFFAVIPITATVLVLGFTVGGMDLRTALGFVIGAVMLIIGMGLFTLGADIAMMPMGETMGSSLTKTKKLWLILSLTFMTGVLVTMAEPGLSMLANRLNSTIIVIIVGIGVGLFLILAMLKTIFQLDLHKLLLILYGIVFAAALVLSLIGKGDFLSIAFDSGGASGGAITVPFIMAYGIGIAAIKGGEKSSDSFGYIAFAALGPVLAVLVWSIFSPPLDTPAPPDTTLKIIDFLRSLPDSLLEVIIPLAAISAFFIIFQFTLIKMPKRNVARIFIGLIYVLFGLAIFLTGANIGFFPVGYMLGESLAEKSYNWLLIPVGILLGCFIVAVEPAISVLKEKVEDVSGGTIKKNTILYALMAAVGASIGIAMLRVLYHINIWWMLAPAYIISLALSFFVPKVFTAIAFDSGGVASGPMTAAFLLPLAMGACYVINSEFILTDAFGVIALVTMSPPVAIQLMGLISMHKAKTAERVRVDAVIAEDYEIIELV